jgi:DNA-binding CsgD family transcriptional regulator
MTTLLPQLSEQRLRVVELVAKGLTNGEIAKELWLAETTVKTHLKYISNLWDVGARAQIVALAYEAGVLAPTGEYRYVGTPLQREVPSSLLPVRPRRVIRDEHIALCFAAEACPCRREAVAS